MHPIQHAPSLQWVFTQIEAAIATFEVQAMLHPVDSPAVAAAITEFEQAWQRFLTDWQAALGQPLPAPDAVSLTLVSRFGLPG